MGKCGKNILYSPKILDCGHNKNCHSKHKNSGALFKHNNCNDCFEDNECHDCCNNLDCGSGSCVEPGCCKKTHSCCPSKVGALPILTKCGLKYKLQNKHF